MDLNSGTELAEIMIMRAGKTMIWTDNTARRIRAGMTITEIMVALAILAIIFTAVLPQFRNINQSWDIKRAAAETLQNERILTDHLTRNLSKADLVLAISAANEDNGFIEFRNDDGEVLRYDISNSNFVQFSVDGSASDIAGPVSFMRFTGYKLDPFEKTTVPGEIRFVTVETSIDNPQKPAGPPTTISTFIQPNGAVPPTETRMIGYWPLDETEIGTVQDNSEFHNDGMHKDFDTTPKFNDSKVGVPGKVKKAVEFIYDYPNDRQAVEIPHIAEYELRNGTVSFWFKCPNFTPYREELVSKDANGYLGGGHFSIWVQFQMVNVRFQSRNNSYYLQSGWINPFADKWNHVAFTFGQSGMRLYINGRLHSAYPYSGGTDTSTGGSGNTEPIALGQNTWVSDAGKITPYHHDAWSRGLTGSIDEVSIFNQALSADEIDKLYRFGTGAIEATEIILP